MASGSILSSMMIESSLCAFLKEVFGRSCLLMEDCLARVYYSLYLLRSGLSLALRCIRFSLVFMAKTNSLRSLARLTTMLIATTPTSAYPHQSLCSKSLSSPPVSIIIMYKYIDTNTSFSMFMWFS